MSPSNWTVEVPTKLLPVIESVKAALPVRTWLGEIVVMSETGLTIVSGNAPELPPPGAGFVMVTEAACGEAIAAAGMIAVSCVALTNVVVSGAPSRFTTDVVTTLVPVTVSVTGAPPAMTCVGLIVASVGTGFDMVRVEVPAVRSGAMAVTVAIPARVPVTWTVPLAWPCGMKTVKGFGLTAPDPASENVTVNPPVGAGAAEVTVSVTACPTKRFAVAGASVSVGAT